MQGVLFGNTLHLKFKLTKQMAWTTFGSAYKGWNPNIVAFFHKMCDKDVGAWSVQLYHMCCSSCLPLSVILMEVCLQLWHCMCLPCLCGSRPFWNLFARNPNGCRSGKDEHIISLKDPLTLFSLYVYSVAEDSNIRGNGILCEVIAPWTSSY